MPEIERPSVRQLRLSNELKRLRHQARRSQKDVRAATGISEPNLSRIENARITITPAEVEQILELYGAPVAVRAELVRIAEEATRHGLWQGRADIWNTGFANLEFDATSIFDFELAFAPGLLQLPGYYRALIRASEGDSQDPAEVERKVAGRIGRQALMSRESPPLLHVVIGETVIRQMVGGPAVMRRQLLELAEASDRPDVTLQVVPFTAGAFPGLDGSFTILDFATYDMQIGYTEGPGGHIYLESAADLSAINVRRDGVLKAALSPIDSVGLLREAADSCPKE